jgi:hypothetical protein
MKIPKTSKPFLTKPAVIAAIAYVLLGLMVLLPFNTTWTVVQSESPNGEPLVVEQSQSFGYRLLLLLIMLIPIVLSIYSINCMMIGNCVVWSYVQAIIIAIWVLMFMTATFMSKESQLEIAKSAPYAIL